MKFLPETLANRVILKPLGVEKVSAGGIDLSAIDTRTKAVNTDRGTVVMVGPAAWYDQPEASRPKLNPGDTVFYARWGAKTIKDEDQEDEFFIICNDVDILVGYSNE